MNKSFNKILCTAAVIAMTSLASPQQAFAEDESWKSSWHVNTIWYQIFPERFCDGDPSNQPEFIETYTSDGKLEKCQVSKWTDENPDWKSKYGGDLKGIDDRIEWFKELGVSGIYLNPVFKATSNHKYNTADYAVIDPAFGDRKMMKKLIDDLHSNKIRLILDGVFNHTGYEFWAFQDIVAKGEASHYKDWYFIKSYPVVKLWEQKEGNGANYACWWGVPTLPQLNLDSENARGYIIDVSKSWLKLGADGWRLDVPNEVRSTTFWQEWSKEMKSERPDCYTSGEIWGNPAEWAGDKGPFTATMNYYGFREPVMQYFTGGKITVSQFDKMLAERRSVLPHKTNCALQNLLSSHDTARILSAIKNHDSQDSDKERKDYDKGPASPEDIAKYKAILAFQMTYVGAPMIYYGDEIGMTGGKDPDCRRPMIWDESKQNRDILECCKKLIAIRSSNKEFRTGEFITLLTDDKSNIYAYERKDGEDMSIVAINYSNSPANIRIKAPKGEYSDLLNGSSIKADKKGIKAELPAYGYAIFKQMPASLTDEKKDKKDNKEPKKTKKAKKSKKSRKSAKNSGSDEQKG